MLHYEQLLSCACPGLQLVYPANSAVRLVDAYTNLEAQRRNRTRQLAKSEKQEGSEQPLRGGGSSEQVIPAIR